MSELKKSLNPFFFNPPANNEWSDEIQRLINESALQMIGRARYQLTPQGRAPVLQLLGLSSPPSNIRWQTLKNAYLIAYAMGLPPLVNDRDRQYIASADGLRASILVNTYPLSAGAYPTLTRARDNLLWQQLTNTSVTARLQKKLSAPNIQHFKPFTQGSVMTLLLNDLLGAERALPWESALKQLVAKAVNARRTSLEELRVAILKIATQKSEPESESEPVSVSETEPESESELTLETFAAQVIKSANRCQTGRFGDNKIFISHVWRQMGLDGKQFGLNIDQFKHRLCLANNKGLVSLIHADLTYAMNSQDVSASETACLNAVFHFIRLESFDVR
ncbi:hypothetical protein [Nitrosomonas cryotolerans]|uniref:hypothetical protein n=1 Tax=Nitrosomonas cryotolerans TaxID=44575 RepID=UPI0011608A42|nr:hypothetical protein [Nitrosomonas cryotolerans]